MQDIKALLLSLFFLISICSNAYAKDNLEVEHFVRQASAEGLIELELAKVALQKTGKKEIKAFAETIITDHASLNNDIANFAEQRNIKVSTYAELSDKTKEFFLKRRDGQYFDDAFVKNQIEAHKKAVKIYRKASLSKNTDLASFALSKLPMLENHLRQVQKI